MSDLFWTIGQSCCALLAWLFLGMVGWWLLAFGQVVRQRAIAMHQIPCTRCQFFTNHPALKCTIHPHRANTEIAITCHDFCPPLC